MKRINTKHSIGHTHGTGGCVCIGIAHRGLSPENTIFGFQNCIRQGVKAIECDVRLSKDDVPVIIHDKNIKRITNGMRSGIVSLLNFEEMSHYGVPRLEEVLDICKNYKVTVCIEIKNIGAKNTLLVDKVLQAVKARKMTSSIVILSFKNDILEYVKTKNAAISTGYLFGPFQGWGHVVNRAMDVRADSLWIYHTLINDKVMRDAEKKGIHVIAWTVNKEKVVRNMKTIGVHGIVSDDIGIIKMFET